MSNSEKIEAFRILIQDNCREILDQPLDEGELKALLHAVGNGFNVVAAACQDKIDEWFIAKSQELGAIDKKIGEYIEESKLDYPSLREDDYYQDLSREFNVLEEEIGGKAGPTGYEFGEFVLRRSRSGNFSWRRKDDWDSSSDYC